MKKLIQQFLENLEVERGRSINTVQNYDFYLRRFLKFSKIKSADQITLDLIERYYLWLNREAAHNSRPLKKSTQNYHLIALRQFLKYLTKQGIKTLPPEKIKLAKMPERQVKFLERDDSEKLLATPLEANEPKIIRLRDKTILEFLFSSGLRVSELSGLKRDQINLNKNEFAIKGKNNKLRAVRLSNQTKYWLKQYLEARRDLSPFLFVRADRAKGKKAAENLTPRSIQRLIKKYSKTAGIARLVTPRTMRHSFATDLLTSGANIRSVQTMLGHSSVTTTRIYTQGNNQPFGKIHKTFCQRKMKD